MYDVFFIQCMMVCQHIYFLINRHGAIDLAWLTLNGMAHAFVSSISFSLGLTVFALGPLFPFIPPFQEVLVFPLRPKRFCYHQIPGTRPSSMLRRKRYRVVKNQDCLRDFCTVTSYLFLIWLWARSNYNMCRVKLQHCKWKIYCHKDS